MQKVLWEDAELYGLVIEPEVRFEQTVATMQTLRTASTWGEVRAAELAPWAQRLVTQYEQDVEAFDGTVLADDQPWQYDDISESVVEAMPLPHDVASTRDWLDAELLEAHAEVGGASPGGAIDGYHVRDRDAFLNALRDAGYEPEHRPGLLDELFRGPA